MTNLLVDDQQSFMGIKCILRLKMWFNVRVTIRLSLGGLELGIHFHWKTVLLLAQNKGRGKGGVTLEGSEREERVVEEI